MGITSKILKDYLGQDLGLDTSAVDESTALFSSGLLDSFAVADLLVFLEVTGGFDIGPTEVIMENFDTIGSILRFSQEKES